MRDERIHPLAGRRLAPTLVLAAGLALSGCSAGIGEAFQEAGDQLAGLFAAPSGGVVETGPVRETDPAAEAQYQSGLEARAGGATDQGFRSFMVAARLGHAAAAYEVSRAYAEGRGVAPDLESAAHWTNWAAERGEARAQFLIGAAYYGGVGIPQDYEAAAKYLRDSAIQGHAQAQYLLGEAYSNERGVDRDAAWAARWYGKAAAQGLGAAQYAYGVAHASGLGLPKNLPAGYAWLVLAARANHEDAKTAGQAVVARLSPDQIERAESWAAHFQPRRATVFADRATVIYVQHTLNQRRYDAGPVDGMAGPMTRAAVKRFQAETGSAVDGRVSADLVERLRAK